MGVGLVHIVSDGLKNLLRERRSCVEGSSDTLLGFEAAALRRRSRWGVVAGPHRRIVGSGGGGCWCRSILVVGCGV